jgi:hypothetical protein
MNVAYWHITTIAAQQHIGRYRSEAENWTYKADGYTPLIGSPLMRTQRLVCSTGRGSGGRSSAAARARSTALRSAASLPGRALAQARRFRLDLGRPRRVIRLRRRRTMTRRSRRRASTDGSNLVPTTFDLAGARARSWSSPLHRHRRGRQLPYQRRV